MDEPQCPACRKSLSAGHYWWGSNYCRAAYLLHFVDLHPDISAWEMHQQTGLSYRDVQKALPLARNYEALDFEEEERPGGGLRYRYRVRSNWVDVIARWRELGFLTGERTREAVGETA